MIMLKVSQMLAMANQEKINEKMLYWTHVRTQKHIENDTYNCLNMEEEHPDDSVARAI